MDKEKDSSSEKGDGGFSEKELDLDIEIRAGEWQNLKKFQTYQKRSRQGKIIATYQAVSNRLNQLVGMYYKFVGSNPREAKKMLAELKKLRLIQEILLNCLVWSRPAEQDLASQEERSDFASELKDRIPREVWDLIK